MKNMSKQEETALFGPEDHEAPIVKGKHTPGPWKTHGFGSDRFITIEPSNSGLGSKVEYLGLVPVNEDAAADMIQYVDNDNKFQVPKGEHIFFLHENYLANARLIAAAPELLEALENLRNELRAHLKFNVKKHFSLMVADAAAAKAIAKAEGRT